MAHNLSAILALMLVTDDDLLRGRDPVEVCRAAERGGVTAVQLRLKRATPRTLLSELRRLRGGIRIPVLVNDRLDVALAGGADGVHLGPDEVPVQLARRVAPAGFVIGASVGSDREREAGAGAGYWGIGPFRSTLTKSDAGPGLGPDGWRRLAAGAGVPCVAIGGVRPSDVPALLAAGATGVAVISGILAAEDIEEAARAYRRALDGVA